MSQSEYAELLAKYEALESLVRNRDGSSASLRPSHISIGDTPGTWGVTVGNEHSAIRSDEEFSSSSCSRHRRKAKIKKRFRKVSPSSSRSRSPRDSRGENKCQGNPARCCAAPHTVTEAHGAENACRGNPASGQPAPHSHALLVPLGVENVCQKNHTRCHGAPHGQARPKAQRRGEVLRRNLAGAKNAGGPPPPAPVRMLRTTSVDEAGRGEKP